MQMQPNHGHPRTFKAVLAAYLGSEALGGLAIILAACAALFLASGPYSSAYFALVNAKLTIGFGTWVTQESLKDWVKDIPMAVFFLSIGLEIKREFCVGFLRESKNITLPLVCALCGMAVPSLIYLGVNAHESAHFIGFAIPSETDISFAFAVLLLSAPKIPQGAKNLLLALAIFDDIGPIIIIGGVFHEALRFMPLTTALPVLAALALGQWLRVTMLLYYLAGTLALCLCFFSAGLQTTLAGFFAGLFVPMHASMGKDSPLERLLHILNPVVNYGVLPLFALTNAGVDLRPLHIDALISPLPLGIALGLCLGKPLGIFLAGFGLIKTGLARLPEHTSWLEFLGLGALAGIGFTMSLYIGALAFPQAQNYALVKTGVLAGSCVAGIFGSGILLLARRLKTRARTTAHSN